MEVLVVPGEVGVSGVDVIILVVMLELTHVAEEWSDMLLVEEVDVVDPAVKLEVVTGIVTMEDLLECDIVNVQSHSGTHAVNHVSRLFKNTNNLKKVIHSKLPKLIKDL